MAGQTDYTIYQGATFTKTITWSIDGTPVNLTGYEVRMQVRPGKADNTATVYLEATTGADARIVLADQATSPGQFTITIPASVTTALDWSPTRPAFYDIELESVGGVVTRLLEGLMFMNKEVTRTE